MRDSKKSKPDPPKSKDPTSNRPHGPGKPDGAGSKSKPSSKSPSSSFIGAFDKRNSSRDTTNREGKDEHTAADKRLRCERAIEKSDKEAEHSLGYETNKEKAVMTEVLGLIAIKSRNVEVATALVVVGVVGNYLLDNRVADFPRNQEATRADRVERCFNAEGATLRALPPTYSEPQNIIIRNPR